MGTAQKILYLHLPSALVMFGACLGVFIGGIGYIWQRQGRWEDLGRVSAELAVILSAIVLVTGMVWGHYAWGQWWTWSPRLTFSLILWLLYVAYLVLHRSLPAGNRRALVCALYGIVAFLDVPLVYLSTTLIPDVHPAGVQLEPRMQLTLLACLLPVAMLSAGWMIERCILASGARARSDELAAGRGTGGSNA